VAAGMDGLKERYMAQFGAEFFNFRNRADFAVPSAVDPEKGLRLFLLLAKPAAYMKQIPS
jgi:hypothetical protein